jgi:hypothetical protein
MNNYSLSTHKKSIVYASGQISFVAQIVTGLIDVLALQVDVKNTKLILKQLLFIELIVQLIEASFYLWFLKNYHTVEDITRFRYFDWMLSTTLMLFTLMTYIAHLQNEEKTLEQIYKENKQTMDTVLLLNLLMLQIGYLGEIGKLDTNISVSLGFIPFLLYFKLIHHKFVKNAVKNVEEVKGLYWYFFNFWSLYGVAAIFPYKQKNVSYNVLDLFSKNFFGLFLSYKVYTNRQKL